MGHKETQTANGVEVELDPDRSLVYAATNDLTGGSVKTIWSGTQAQYEAISVKDDSTLYLIVSA